ncbi:MAG: glycosyltransferase [Neomegalonema sp.]|nr:glycosyltransferase [Neomegalonema sp.]
MMDETLTIRPGAVVHVVNKMQPGGIETLVLDLARKDVDDIAIISLEMGADELVAAWPALAPYRSRLIGLRRPPGLQPKLSLELARIFRALKPRAVIAHHIGPLLYSAGAVKLAGPRRFVHVEHDVWHYAENPKHVKILKLVELIARPRHIAVSTPIRDRMRELIPKANITVSPPGIDTARFAKGDKAAAMRKLGLPETARLIGTAGRLEAVKAQHVLIEAMSALAADVHCVIAGEGSERPALEAKIAELGLGARVTLLGHRDDLFELMPGFDLFCLPSLNEGLPRVVLEAQACDVPVIASDVGALKDAINPATGALTPAGDSEALASALAARLHTPPPAGATRAFVVENFDFERVWERFSEAAGPRIE